MSPDGTWTITMKTPLGAQPATLHFITQGSALTGKLESRLGSGEFLSGSVDGQTLTWRAALRLPAPLSADFHATIVDDTISGHVILGSFGKAPFNGVRS